MEPSESATDFYDERGKRRVELRSVFGADVGLEGSGVTVLLVDKEGVGLFCSRADSKEHVARLVAHAITELMDEGGDGVPFSRQGGELCVQNNRRAGRDHALAAPVMMATASVMLCDFGVMVAARFPNRCMCMRSATSNTLGML